MEYEEIAKKDPLLALKYLQTKVSDIVDHNDSKELKEVKLILKKKKQSTVVLILIYF